MNVQQLRYLVATADAGTISGAARVLDVSQPVMSRALHTLEADLGVRLFELDGRCLGFTAAGTQVAAAARRALDAVDEVVHTAERLALGPELVVVATPTNSVLLSPIVAAYMRHRPAVALHLRRASEMAQVLRMVASGEADLGFGELGGNLEVKSLEYQFVWMCDVVLVSPTGTAMPAAIPVAQLADISLVLPPADTERRMLIDDLVTDAGGRKPSAALATDERSAWTSSAQRGLASFLSYQAVAAEYDGVELRPFEPPIRVPVGFIKPTGGASPEGSDLIELAFECDVPLGCERAATSAAPRRHDRQPR